MTNLISAMDYLLGFADNLATGSRELIFQDFFQQVLPIKLAIVLGCDEEPQ